MNFHNSFSENFYFLSLYFLIIFYRSPPSAYSITINKDSFYELIKLLQEMMYNIQLY